MGTAIQSALRADVHCAGEALRPRRFFVAQYYKEFKSVNPNGDALWPTILKAVSQVGLAGLAGAVSGSVMGGGAQLMSRGTLQQMGSQMRSTDSLNELIETGKSLDPASSAYRMATRLETRTNLGKGVSDLDIGRQYAANQFAEGAEQRTAFRVDIKVAELDRRTTQAALRVYGKLIKGESAGKREAAKLQASLRSAAAQKAEINADLTVTRTEAKIRLQQLYTAMQQAAQAGDFATFQAAKEQYVQSFDLEQAKHQAVKVRAQNRINTIDNDVKTEISNSETRVKVQPTATAVGNGVNTAAAETAGRASTIGNTAQDEAQGQFAASPSAGNSGILNQERTGSEQGSGAGAGNYEPDIIIGRSLGAKAENYDIFTPDGEILNLSEGTHIKKVEVIAGQGRNRQIEMVDSLVDKYGGDRAKWKKCKGQGYVDLDGESYLVELHWYEEPSTGRVEFKIKRQSGGGWFINED